MNEDTVSSSLALGVFRTASPSPCAMTMTKSIKMFPFYAFKDSILDTVKRLTLVALFRRL